MKHNVLSADTLSKFIVIASACRGTETQASNLMRTAEALHRVRAVGRTIKGVELVTGFYAEQGQEGAYEQSMAIATDSPQALKAIKRMFCVDYDQDCILVWNRDTNSVWLLNETGFLAELGTKGMGITEDSLSDAMLRGRILPDAYTIDASGAVWEVR